MEPVISPAKTSFADTLTITITQDQGYDIYYSIDGTKSKKYSDLFNIDKTATVSAFTKAMVNGVQVLSEKVSVDYTKCGENEDLVDGECTVVSSCADNEELIDGECVKKESSNPGAWNNWPNPQWCPATNPDPDCFACWHHTLVEGEHRMSTNSCTIVHFVSFRRDYRKNSP